MWELERGDRMPWLGEHVTFGGLRCLVIAIDNETGSVTLQPLEDLPEAATAALRAAIAEQNKEVNRWWKRSPCCGTLPAGSLYDKDGNLRSVENVLNEIIEICGREGAD